MLYTNEKTWNKFGDFLQSELKRNDIVEVQICVGYISFDTLYNFKNILAKITKYGSVRIVLGMYCYDRNLKKEEYDDLIKLKNYFITYSGRDTAFDILITRIPYHGKIYRIVYKDGGSRIFIGSSNFSKYGLDLRNEAEIEIPSTSNPEVEQYIHRLISLYGISINYFNIKKRRKGKNKFDYKKSVQIPTGYSSVLKKPIEIPFRINEQTKSSLNLSFGCGRYNASNKSYTPRPWFEAEFSFNKKERECFNTDSILGSKYDYYPRGKFKAYLHYHKSNKYYLCEMKTYSDNNKAMSTCKNRLFLGAFVKTKLLSRKLLNYGDLITQDILKKNNSTSLYFDVFEDKRKNRFYIITF